MEVCTPADNSDGPVSCYINICPSGKFTGYRHKYYYEIDTGIDDFTPERQEHPFRCSEANFTHEDEFEIILQTVSVMQRRCPCPGFEILAQKTAAGEFKSVGDL